ncbi:MAG: hypothetical protein LBE84_10280 [Planctomycetota bacterium]|jgi:hypothetical protein|nr:hypothetical protein [Planctomycetota bacterium]
MRPKDFFREVRLDFNAIARMIMGFAEKVTRQPLVFAMDRTGWQIRGKHEDNLLVLGVCLGGLGLPVRWPNTSFTKGKQTAVCFDFSRIFDSQIFQPCHFQRDMILQKGVVPHFSLLWTDARTKDGSPIVPYSLNLCLRLYGECPRFIRFPPAGK